MIKLKIREKSRKIALDVLNNRHEANQIISSANVRKIEIFDDDDVQLRKFRFQTKLEEIIKNSESTSSNVRSFQAS